MKADGVFQGGGVKGIGFIGAVCRFEEENIKWQKLAGTSAGALIASLLAVGYSGKELKKIMMELNYTDLAKKNIVQSVPVLGKPLGLMIEKGLFNTSSIQKYLYKLYEKKGKTKFKDVSVDGESRLKIIASDITNKRLLILPDDIKYYGINPMELGIDEAVIMSITIPFVFVPVKLTYMGKKSYIVDGGIMSNYPIWIFDVKRLPRWPTFGFKFEKAKENESKDKKCDFFNYISDLIGAIMDNYDETYITDKDRIRTISIPTLGVKTTDFNISIKMKNKLFDAGYKSADVFINEWDFRKYLKSRAEGREQMTEYR